MEVWLLSKNLDELKEGLNNPYAQQAVVIGYLFKNFNQLTTARYNKVATTLGFDRQSASGLQALLSYIQEDAQLLTYLDKGVKGLLTLDDLDPQPAGEEVTDEAIFNVLSTYTVANEEVLANNREFRKIQKEGAQFERLFKGLQKQLYKELQNVEGLKPHYLPNEDFLSFEKTKDNKDIVACLNISDWHVGATIKNVGFGDYNFNILVERINLLIKGTLRYIKLMGVTELHIHFNGDLVEHVNMRNVNQAFDAEFPLSEQIIKGQQLLIDLIKRFDNVEQLSKIVFGITAGNHDRFQGNKADKIFNDNVAYIVLENLRAVKDLGLFSDKVTIIDNHKDTYSFEDNIGGGLVKVNHGDHEKKSAPAKIAKYIKNQAISLLELAHVHSVSITQEDYYRFHIYNGSPMGANEYSKENNFPTTAPSQNLILFDKVTNSYIFVPIRLDRGDLA